MGPFGKKIVAKPNDYLKKCFALLWAEYLELVQQYDNEIPLRWAPDHGALVFQRLIEADDKLLSLWLEVVGELEAAAWAGRTAQVSNQDICA